MTSSDSSQVAGLPVRIELALPQPCPPSLDLRGEIDDWAAGRVLLPEPPDDGACRFRCDLQLPPGVYAYKLRAGTAWLLDPGNPRTRTNRRDTNNVLCVGGTPEPVIFAPGLPLLAHHPRGGVVITALLRKGHGHGLRITWSEGRPETESLVPMSQVGQEAEHLVFQVHLPASTRTATFRFLLDDGTVVGAGEDGNPFACPPGPEPLPAWWTEGVIYTVFVDRFRPATDSDAWTRDPGPDRHAGGHLDGVTRSLDHLADLGVTILHLTPIHLAVSCHRYDLTEPMKVDPAVGGEASFRRLIKASHARGLRVLLDFSFLHVGRTFEAYEDVRRNGLASRFASWFRWRDREDGKVLRHYGGRRDAPLLDLRNPDVQDLVVRTASHWARFGVDGFRLDAVAQIPLSLGKRIRDALRAHVPDGLVYGEVVPEHAWRWAVAGAVDTATDFRFHRTVTSFVAERSVDAAEAAERLRSAERDGALPGARSVRFISTHDHNRFATLASVRGDENRTALALLLLAAAPGVPMLVYGEEIGMAAKLAGLRPEGVWEDRMPMPWKWTERQAAFHALTRSLLHARRAHPALRDGDLQIIHAEDRLLVARRTRGTDVVDIVVNASDLPVELDLDDDWLSNLEPVASVGDVRTRGQAVALGPNAGVLARRSPPLIATGSEPPRARMLRRMRDEAFAAGAPEAPTRPTRIDFSLTERCNLRCRHCINHSPERTCQRSARTLSHAVLDRLREDFAHASYYGFVHGGESLAAPILFDVLEAVRFARGGAPAMIHVLSNGMLLTPRNAARLLDAGVRSLSVSLDGATAETNDRIRVGSSLDEIVRHIREIVAMREERRADLRLGVSCVVTRDNVHELPALAELVAGLGVDWLKLEELVPSTPAAREMMIDPTSGEARGRIQAALDTARSLGLVAVDHTAPPRVWRCKLEESPEMETFLTGDQYANRSEIHPCRSPWEIACVEPNGDVHIESFHGPVLGNVMAEPLAVLWNGPVARSERIRSRNERLCEGGPVTCLA